MIRRVYIDFIKNRLAEKNLSWVIKRGIQYLLIHLSFLSKRALSGPILGTIITNYTCNYNCRMCDISMRNNLLKKKGLALLSTEQFKNLIEDFADLGISGIGFTGGEPMLRKDIFGLIAHTKQLGMISHFNTNGSIINRENSKTLVSSGVDSINLSLDGARAGTHDSMRGVKGAYEATMNAVRVLQSASREMDRRVRLKFVTVLNEGNIDEAGELTKLAGDMGISRVEFIPEQQFYEDTALRSSKYNEVFFKKLHDALSFLSKYKDKEVKIENSPRHLGLFEQSFKNAPSTLRCYAGYNSLCVDCYGEIYPCLPWANWGKSVANIKEVSLKDFWVSSKYNRLRRTVIDKCKNCYLNCQTELNLLFNP